MEETMAPTQGAHGDLQVSTRATTQATCRSFNRPQQGMQKRRPCPLQYRQAKENRKCFIRNRSICSIILTSLFFSAIKIIVCLYSILILGMSFSPHKHLHLVTLASIHVPVRSCPDYFASSVFASFYSQNALGLQLCPTSSFAG